MIEVKIPAEIQEYKAKLFFGLSTRKCIAIAGIIIVGLTITMLGKNHLSQDTLGWLVILSVAPFAGWGFMTYKDMTFEVFMKAFLAFNIFPQKRVYEDTDVNIFSSLKEEILADNAFNQRVENGEIDIDEEEEYV